MLTLFATVEHASKTAYYVAAGLLASWAVVVGLLGVTRPSFPHGPSGARIVMGVSFLLMVSTMIAAVSTG
jgi:hypothetical protein